MDPPSQYTPPDLATLTIGKIVLSTTPIDDIPVELLNHVLDHFHNDAETLKRLRLVPEKLHKEQRDAYSILSYYINTQVVRICRSLEFAEAF